jgi:hypothetical protein
MSNNLVIPGDSPIKPAHDPYWDKPMTRREAHTLFMKLAGNDNELMGMADTAAILINFICEKKLGIVDRTEVDAYVLVKTEELKAMRAAMKAAAEAAAVRGEDPEAAAEEARRKLETPQTGQAPDAQPHS